LWENRVEVEVFPWLGLLFIRVSNLFLANLHSKIGMSANYKKCVPGKNEQLSYWPILNFYSEIWRMRKKTKSSFKEI
jgi:hypothetical protein